jgi:hypothetical protein
MLASLVVACGPSRLPPTVARSLPDGVDAPRRLLDERAVLVGNGKSACTHQVPASANGDRWCAFTLPASENGTAELWAIDVTSAVTGRVPPCDGTDAGCLRLTDSLPLRSSSFFDGDTLIYEGAPVSGPTEDFLGPLYAWRPGWSRGRQISSDRAFTCIGQVSSAAAACFGEPAGDPAKRDSAQVSAGYLLDEGGGSLPSLGRWPLRNDNDTAWAAGFSPDGATFVLSNAAIIGAKQTLRTVATAETDRSPLTVAMEDVEYWQPSNDGAQVYFLRGLPQRADLFVADFPSGQGARLIEAGILSFSLVGDRPENQALEFVKDLGGTKGEFKLLRDRSQTTPKSIFTFEDILDGAHVSPDLRYTVWMDFAFRGVVIRNEDLAPCSLDIAGEPPVFEPAFLDHAGLLFWKELRPGPESHWDAFFAPPDRCRAKQSLGQDIEFFAPVGDRGLIFADEHDADAGRSTLKYVPMAPDGANLDERGPVQIQERVGASVVFVGTDPLLLVFPVVGASPDTSGTFVFGPVPL